MGVLVEVAVAVEVGCGVSVGLATTIETVRDAPNGFPC